LSSKDSRPKVGVGVLVFRPDPRQTLQVLLGKRLSPYGFGAYGAPGGHLEFGESFEDCAKREVAEECGIGIKDLRYEYLTNIVNKDSHYVHIGYSALYADGEVQTLEPKKCEAWGWYSLDALPQPLFPATQLDLQNFKQSQDLDRDLIGLVGKIRASLASKVI